MSETYDDFCNDFRRMFAIETHDNVLVGLTNMSAIDQKNGTFGFSISINKSYRKNGYALDAARIVMRYAFHELRLQKCNSGCVSINDASRALHLKLGFREEGLRRRTIYMNGQFYDDLVLGLLREEFDEAERLLHGR
ncbi:putative ribosomal N-acetyltransferase YdaF [compost metagenome]